MVFSVDAVKKLYKELMPFVVARTDQPKSNVVFDFLLKMTADKLSEAKKNTAAAIRLERPLAWKTSKREFMNFGPQLSAQI